MAALRLKAIITEDRQLLVNLPDYIVPGEVEIILQTEEPITDEELAVLMQPDLKSPAEIIAMLHEMGAAYQHISDSAAWVDELRREQEKDSLW